MFLPTKFPLNQQSLLEHQSLRTLLIFLSSTTATIAAPVPLRAQDGLHRSTARWQVP